MTIVNNGGGYGEVRNITGFWDISNYGLRPSSSLFIDNYNYPLNPKRRTDNIQQTTVKNTEIFDKKEAYLSSLYSINMPQDIIPTLNVYPNAMKAYLIPVLYPKDVPKNIPIKNTHFVYNRDTSDKKLEIGIDTCPPTLNNIKNHL
jgi:hypothetical protein